MKVVAIHQPQYLPYLGFFHKLRHCDAFVILDNVQFQKNGLQNRNKIKTSQGWQWLTVPVLHRAGQLIYEVRINPTAHWQKKHWNALVSNYSQALYFDVYNSGLRDLVDNDWKNLCELNIALMRWAMDVLDIKTPILRSSVLGANGQQTELLINICKTVEADYYLSGPGGRLYMDLAAFEAADLTVVWQEFTPPVYSQVFLDAGFLPNLSIIDALFCCGPETIRFLEQGGRSQKITAQAHLYDETDVSNLAEEER